MREKTNALFVKRTVILVKHELSRGSVDDHGIYCGLQGRKKLLAIYSRERGGKKSILRTLFFFSTQLTIYLYHFYNHTHHHDHHKPQQHYCFPKSTMAFVTAANTISNTPTSPTLPNVSPNSKFANIAPYTGSKA